MLNPINSIRPHSAIAVLGNGLISNNQLPLHMTKRLNIVAGLYTNKPEEDKPILAVLGKWSFWNRKATIPSITEAEAMQQHLLSRGIPKEAIFAETQSEDTIGNAFALKEFLEVSGIKHITIACADYHEERATYIFRKILGEGYALDFLATQGPYEGTQLEEQKIKQRKLLEEQKPFIAKLLRNPLRVEHLYDLPYYTEQLGREINDTGKTALGLDLEMMGSGSRK